MGFKSAGFGWVVAEVAPVMIFLEWVCSGGFQIGWVWLGRGRGRGRGRGLLWSCLGFKSAPVMIFFLSAWVCVCGCVCGLCKRLREPEKK